MIHAIAGPGGLSPAPAWTATARVVGSRFLTKEPRPLSQRSFSQQIDETSQYGYKKNCRG